MHTRENNPTIVFRAGPECPLRLTEMSQAIVQFGYRAEDLRGNPDRWRTLLHGADLAGIETDMRAIIAGRALISSRRVRLRGLNGDWFTFDAEIRAVRDEHQRVIAFECAMTAAEEPQWPSGRIVPLRKPHVQPSLLNRKQFIAELQTATDDAASSGDALAVFYLDVDHFKDINAVYGHETGDLFLLAVSRRLMGAAREPPGSSMAVIARFGGDEFAVLHANIGAGSDAAAYAQHIKKKLSEPYAINGKTIYATVSIGVSVYDPASGAPNDALVQADFALHRAKKEGRNQVQLHSTDLVADARERAAIADDLHAALPNGEMVLYYQPQVEITSGRIVGLEALMRWVHPKRGIVTPDQFIPVAEKIGLIATFGQWAIEEACTQIARWRAEGFSPPAVGVNVSAIQIRAADEFVRMLRRALHKARLEPRALELELTEAILADAAIAPGDILHRLRDMGVSIAIDDFGNGHSLLQRQKSVPISRIKIARRFMTNVSTSSSDAAIVRAAIGLAHALDLDVVAEGVESAEQLSFLKCAVCKNAQGFYFSPPIPAEHMEEFLRRGTLDFPQDPAANDIGAR